MSVRALAATLLAATSLIACGNTDGGADGRETAALDQRSFLSQSAEGRELVPGTVVRLAFDGGNLSASAGCNSLGAAFEVVDGRLVLRGGVSTTDMGCDPPRHAQDEWLASLLQSTPRLVLEGDNLTITTDDAVLRLLDRVVADPDRPVVGTRWRVDTVFRGDAASSVPGEEPVILEVGPDGELIATATGCTSVRVPVDIDEAEATMRFGQFGIDDIRCAPPWDETLEVLRSGAARYSITAGRLTLTAGAIGIGAVAE